MQRGSLPVWLMATDLFVCRSCFTVTWKTAVLLSGGAQIRGSFLLHQSGQRHETVFFYVSIKPVLCSGDKEQVWMCGFVFPKYFTEALVQWQQFQVI